MVVTRSLVAGSLLPLHFICCDIKCREMLVLAGLRRCRGVQHCLCVVCMLVFVSCRVVVRDSHNHYTSPYCHRCKPFGAHVPLHQMQTPTPGTADVMLMPPPSHRPPSNLPAATPPQVGSVPPPGYFSNPNTPHQFSVPSPAVFSAESSGIEPQLQ